MPKRRSQHPTEAELEILNVLWRHGPATVRQVHEVLQADRTTALTTTLKLMQVMTEKGVLVRTDSRPHQYESTARKEQTQTGLLKDLTQRAFEGSVSKLLVRAVQDGGLSGEELQEVRKLIDEARKAAEGDQ